MKILSIVLLLSCGLLLAQDNAAKNDSAKDSKGQITVTGCVSRSNGNYILMKQNLSYQLQPAKNMRLKDYLGRRVEVTGKTSPTMSTSSDAMNKVGSASPVTINIQSIKVLDPQCSEAPVSR